LQRLRAFRCRAFGDHFRPEPECRDRLLKGTLFDWWLTGQRSADDQPESVYEQTFVQENGFKVTMVTHEAAWLPAAQRDRES
jgi:hypothetical protein